TTIAGTSTTFSQPSIFVRSSGEADVVARGGGGVLDYYWATPGSSWSSAVIQTGITSAANIFVRSTGEADVVANTASHAVSYSYAWPGTAWSHSGI
ncbi:MAG TPA: hypothetical protein VGI39_11800, partial [Polyangiaceae bacterium]